MTHILRINEMAVRYKDAIDRSPIRKKVVSQRNSSEPIITATSANKKVKEIFNSILKDKNYVDLMDTFKYILKTNKDIDGLEQEIWHDNDWCYITNYEDKGVHFFIGVLISRKDYGIEFHFYDDGECDILHPRGENADIDDRYALDDILNTGFDNNGIYCYRVGEKQPLEEHSIISAVEFIDVLKTVKIYIDEISDKFFNTLKSI